MRKLRDYYIDCFSLRPDSRTGSDRGPSSSPSHHTGFPKGSSVFSVGVKRGRGRSRGHVRRSGPVVLRGY